MIQQHSFVLFRWTRVRSTLGSSICSGGSARTLSAVNAPFVGNRRHSSTSSSSSSRDRRLAGRRRFYEHVGTIPVEAPWKTPFDLPVPGTTTSSSSSSSTTTSSFVVQSPISAGVDDSPSGASGITIELPTMEQLHDQLQPRNPCTTNNRAILPHNDDEYWLGVTLDGKSIKTPLGKQLAVPSETLAWTIAAEWDSQFPVIQPTQMPLMTLCCTTIDQVAANPELYRKLSLRFLPTDTTCFWADDNEDRVLYRKQQDAWQDLHEYCEDVLDGKLAVARGASEGLVMSRTRPDQKKDYFGLPHSPTLYDNAKTWVNSLDAWHLCALHSVASEAKSFLVAMAVILSSSSSSTTSINGRSTIRNNNPFVDDLSKAVTASRVEEEFQIEIWGLVEGGHDYDRLNCAIQIHAAQVLTSAIALSERK